MAIDDRRDDPELVRAAQAGDRGSLDVLLRRHVDRIHALCRRLLAHEADAADATQEALMAVVRGLPAFDGRSAFSTWAYRVTTNACLDELRRRRRRPDPVEETVLQAGTRPDGSAADPLDQVLDRADVDAALRTVAPDFRAAVVLRDLLGLDYAAIAEILEVPAGTVRSRIARGRAAVAAAMVAEGSGGRAGNPPGATERPTHRP